MVIDVIACNTVAYLQAYVRKTGLIAYLQVSKMLVKVFRLFKKHYYSHKKRELYSPVSVNIKVSLSYSNCAQHSNSLVVSN